jgi:hypothetical protein
MLVAKTPKKLFIEFKRTVRELSYPVVERDLLQLIMLIV